MRSWFKSWPRSKWLPDVPALKEAPFPSALQRRWGCQNGGDTVHSTVVRKQTADFYEDWIQKLVIQYDKCPNIGRSYAEK